MHEIVYRPLAELLSAEENPKTHDLDAIETSIARFGFVAPVIVDEETSKIVAGHGRVEALRRLEARGGAAPRGVYVEKGRWHAPVVVGVDLSSDEAKAYLVADNKLSEAGGWDFSKLSDLLGELKEVGIEPAVLGFSASDIKAVHVEKEIVSLAAANAEANAGAEKGSTVDVDEEWKGMPEFDQPDASAERRIVMNFRSQADVEAFGALIGQSVTEKTRSLWYPKAEIDRLMDKRYQKA